MAQTPNSGPGPYQEQLGKFCETNGMRPPVFQVLSDRRGGRTAWSCTVQIQGQPIPARFWYDGQYVNNAREDAAQVALQRLGQLPASGAPPAHLQGQTQQTQGQGQQQQQQQHQHQQHNQSGGQGQGGQRGFSG